MRQLISQCQAAIGQLLYKRVILVMTILFCVGVAIGMTNMSEPYMVVGGLANLSTNHAECIAEMALDMQDELIKFNAKHHSTINIRIGINTGPAIAGIIGTKKFIYDLWGDVVNTSVRMEYHGLPGTIQPTKLTYNILRNKYLFEDRGIIHIKGKGDMNTNLLAGRLVSPLSV